MQISVKCPTCNATYIETITSFENMLYNNYSERFVYITICHKCHRFIYLLFKLEFEKVAGME